jgi:hypothetical protein
VTWTRQPDGSYVSDEGWTLRHVKARGGPIGCQSRHYRVPAHWTVYKPSGAKAADETGTLKGAKLAADQRAAIDARKCDAMSHNGA